MGKDWVQVEFPFDRCREHQRSKVCSKRWRRLSIIGDLIEKMTLELFLGSPAYSLISLDLIIIRPFCYGNHFARRYGLSSVAPV
jgi:hypothetical protein